MVNECCSVDTAVSCMSENNINALCFQQFNKLILMIRLLQDCFHAMFGHLGEFLVLLELLGRISEPFFYCLHTDRFVNLGSLERISDLIALSVRGRIDKTMILTIANFASDFLQGYII